MTRQIVDKAKKLRERYGSRGLRNLRGALSRNAAESSSENYKKFQCQSCDFGLLENCGEPPV